MIKLIDILKEVQEDEAGNIGNKEANLKKAIVDIKNGMINFDKTAKQVAIRVLKQFEFDREKYNSFKEFKDKEDYLGKILQGMTYEKVKEALDSIRKDAASSNAVKYKATFIVNTLEGKK